METLLFLTLIQRYTLKWMVSIYFRFSCRNSFDVLVYMPRLAHAIEGYLEYYNATTETPMKLVMFEDAIEHVARICMYKRNDFIVVLMFSVGRIIRQPGGNALLLGMGGSGRQSLTRLATSIAEYPVQLLPNYILYLI